LNERDLLVDPGVAWRLVLKWILETITGLCILDMSASGQG